MLHPLQGVLVWSVLNINVVCNKVNVLRPAVPNLTCLNIKQPVRGVQLFTFFMYIGLRVKSYLPKWLHTFTCSSLILPAPGRRAPCKFIFLRTRAPGIYCFYPGMLWGEYFHGRGVFFAMQYYLLRSNMCFCFENIIISSLIMCIEGRHKYQYFNLNSGYFSLG